METSLRIDVRRWIAFRVGSWLGPGAADSSGCLSRGEMVSRRADPARRRYVGVRCAFPKLGAHRKRVVELRDDCGRCLRLAAGTDCRGAFRRDAERGGSMGVDAFFQRLLATRLVVRCGGSCYILYKACQDNGRASGREGVCL